MPPLKIQEKPFLFRKQDFYKLRSQCLAEGKLFEDPEFPADDSSLFFNKSSVLQWKRPTELTERPEFISDGGTRFDIQQGNLGDCWLLAGLGCLTLNEKLFQYVVPHDQSFTKNYMGIFHFRLWQFGKWTDVVVDDRLPTGKFGKKLIYVHSSQLQEFWSALLEKAYAKLNGSYEAIEGGFGPESLEDFSGGLAEELYTSYPPENLYHMLFRAHECTALITAGITDGENKNLPSGHEYSITKLKILDEENKLIRVRNPWGNKTEWRGKWSDKSPEWERIPINVREEIGLVCKKDGEFWMDFNDFLKHFDDITICHLNPMCLHDLSESCTNNAFKQQTFMGVWTRGISAGGRFDEDTFWRNPQFLVTLVETDEGNTEGCTLIVALMQKKRRAKYHLGKEDLEIGFYIFEVLKPEEQPKPLPELFFESSDLIGGCEFSAKREVLKRFVLDPGTYCIVPATIDKNTHGRFMLRIFTERECKVEEYDYKNELCDVNQKVFGFPKTICFERNQSSIFDSLNIKLFEKIFNEECGRNGDVDWLQLMRILQKTVKGSLYNYFTKHSVRVMIEAVDTNKCGRINFEEFKALVYVLNNLMIIFEDYDESKSGFITVLDLKESLRRSGYIVDSNILSTINIVYGTTDGKIALDDYFTVSLKLKTILGFITEDTSNDKNKENTTYDKELFQILLFM